MSSIAEAPARATNKSKRKVQHWFHATELERAHDVGGLVLLAYCGRPEKCGTRSEAPMHIIDVVGGLMAVNGPRDCRTCVRAYEAGLRRSGRRRDRWNAANGFND